MTRVWSLTVDRTQLAFVVSLHSLHRFNVRKVNNAHPRFAAILQ